MQLNINSEIVSRKTIHAIFDAMFKDGVYSWGRIVVLYVFTARLAKCYHEQKSNKAFIKILSTYVGDYIARDCALWIKNQGGWTNFCDQFKATDTVKEPSFNAMAMLGLCLGGLVLYHMWRLLNQ
ncbi:Bcl-2-related protein A1 [Holothuria leucospilota]|uniref:Bcl-2-related protein A1 n=1 Tax=Holothuria leucospilota TaxID=206669 RepID=A0A9Q0YDD1_HOLLE|nr:Bcl-2-related protein A1 [Holothuria leucospilota]